MNSPGFERICVVIGRTRHKMVQIEIQEAAKRGAQLMEIRLDFLAKMPDFKRLLANKPCPMIATVRRQEDGGRWTGTEEARRMLLRQAIVAGFDWVDLETDVIAEIRRFKNVKRIVSYHNLRAVPPDLEKIHERMCNQDADVVKIAVLAQHTSENLRVLELLKDPLVPTVAFCLGDFGFPSRILSGKFGSPFTYGAFNKERTLSLGIPSFQELKDVYHFHEVNADTAVYGVIGDPIAHSLSPLIHNGAMRKLGINGMYLPFRVARGDLLAFLKNYDRIPVCGYSVTIPHKEGALVSARHQEASATLIRAANTLVKVEDGFKAYNTDYQAALDSLRANMPTAPDGQPARLDGLAALVLGAGGVAHALAHAVHGAGARVTIANRTFEHGQRLAEEVGCRVAAWEARHSVTCDVLVNCTPIGMTPEVDESPIHHSFLKQDMTIFDTIYTPETTLLIKEARERGCHAITGVDMFVRQAAAQFRLFTGKEAPLELMHGLVKRALSPISLAEGEEP